jgi:hypothetical protein
MFIFPFKARNEADKWKVSAWHSASSWYNHALQGLTARLAAKPTGGAAT